MDLRPGRTSRVRLINTDNGPTTVWVTGGSFVLAAVDGRDVHQPLPVRDQGVTITAGGRADLLITAPADGNGVRVELPGASIVLGPPGATAPAPARTPSEVVDLLHYGTPQPLPFDPARASRHFRYDIGRRFGLVNGRPGLFWTINGRLFPDTPMFMVAEGDIATMTISNHSGEVHPIHLHGHRVVVLSRNGAAATGSPWIVDSLNVEDGDSYEVAFIADNPGIWMDHCHNLRHAAEGFVAHLMYEGVTTPFVLGSDAKNHPE